MADFVNNIEVLQYKAPKHLPDANSKHINSAEQTNACLTQQIRNAMELSGVVRPTSLVRSDEVDPLFLSKSIQQQAMFAQSYEIDASSTANNIIIIPAVQDKQLSTVKLDDNGTEITPIETNVVGTVDGQVFDEIQNGSIFQFIPTLNNTSSTVNLTVRIKHLKWDSGTSTQIVETKDFTYPVKSINGISDISISGISRERWTIVQFDATLEVFKLLSNEINLTVRDFKEVGDTDDTNAINKALAFSKKVNFGVNESYVYNDGIPPFDGHHIEAIDCEIIVPAGSYHYTSERYINGCSGNALKFTFTNGTSYNATSSSYTGSAKNYAVTFSGISSTAGLAINDFVLIRTLVPSKTNVVWVTGCWKVTNVTANSITVNNTYHGATPPSIASITSVTIKKLPTKIQWTGDNGFSFHNGAFFDFSGGAVFIGDWDVLAGTGTQGAHGIVINAPRIIGGASSNTTVMGGGGVGTNADICLYGWGEQGCAIEGSPFASTNFIISCANRKRGLYVSGSGSDRAKFSITNGNGEDGCISDECSNASFPLGYSCGNGLNGYWSTSLSYINASSSIAVGNLTNGYEVRGSGRLSCDNTKSFNNGARGYSLTDGGNMDCDNAIADGNLSDGFYIFLGGTVDANNASSINNGGWGVNGEFANMNFSGSGTFTGNTLGEFNPQMQGMLGYTNSGRYPFIHQELKTTDGGLLRVVGSTGLATTFSNSSIGDLSIQVTSGGGIQIRNGNVVRPIVDNTTSLGEAARRWTTVFATTSTINTSDENAKQDIREFTDTEIKVAKKLKTMGCIFKFKDAVEKKGDNARLHVGFIAQQVAQVFIDNGLTPENYGLFCKDLQEDGTYIYGLRYEELLTFIVCVS